MPFTSALSQVRGISVLLALVGLGLPPAHAQLVEQAISVGVHHDTASVNRTRLHQAFLDATKRLQTDAVSGSADVACEVEFFYSGKGRRFAAGDDTVNTAAEFWDIIQNAAGYIRIVDSITWCGVTGTFLGCAPLNTEQGFLVTRHGLQGPSGGVVLAHEFGHTVGLPHVTAPNNIMRGSASTANNRVTASQCAAFREAVSSNRAARRAVAELLPHGQTESFTHIPIAQVAAHPFIDTVPVEVEDYYGQEDVAVLQQLLADPEQVNRHPTILSLIGLISNGSQADVRALIDYVALGQGSPAGKTAAGIALGYLVHRTGHHEALQFLVEQSASGDVSVAVGAVQGLGVSGDRRALTTLEQAQQRGWRGPKAGLVAQAIYDNYTVRDLGLRRYYNRE